MHFMFDSNCRGKPRRRISDVKHFEKSLQTNREKAQQQIVDLIEQKQPTTYEGADIEELEQTERGDGGFGSTDDKTEGKDSKNAES